MDENKCTVNGINYTAKDSVNLSSSCDGCVAEYNDELCRMLGECRMYDRKDGRYKIWIYEFIDEQRIT